jgi:hypothetical protein
MFGHDICPERPVSVCFDFALIRISSELCVAQLHPSFRVLRISVANLHCLMANGDCSHSEISIRSNWRPGDVPEASCFLTEHFRTQSRRGNMKYQKVRTKSISNFKETE